MYQAANVKNISFKKTYNKTDKNKILKPLYFAKKQYNLKQYLHKSD